MSKFLTNAVRKSGSRRDRLIDRLFGYDFFISYAHRDGLGYAANLTAALAEKGYAVFLDKDEFVAGDELDAETKRRIRMSSYLVVLAGPAALDSKWVRKEVELFLASKRTPIVLQMPGVSASEIEQAGFIDPNWIRHVEADTAGPSPETLNALDKAFIRQRRDIVRKRVTTIAALLLFAAVGLGGYSWQTAKQERLQKEIAASEGFAAQARSALDRADFEFAALFALASTRVRSDGVVSDDQRLVLTEASAFYFGTRVKIGDANSGRPRAVAFSRDETRLAIADNEGSIQVATRSEASALQVLDLPHVMMDGVPTGATYVASLQTTLDGTYLLAGDDLGRLHWFSWDNLEHQRSVDAHDGTVWDISISPDGKKVATGGEDNAVRIWEASTGKNLDGIREFASELVHGRPNRVNAVAYSPTEDLVAVATEDNTVQVIDFENQSIAANLTEFPDSEPLNGNWSHFVAALEWHPSGTLVSTGSIDGYLRHWPLKPEAPNLVPSRLQEDRVSMLRLMHFQYLRGGRYVAAAYDSGDLIIVDTTDGSAALRLVGSRHWSEDLKLSTSGRYLANASGDGKVWIWDVDALFEPDLINRLCQTLPNFGIDIGRAWNHLSNDTSPDIVPPTLCDQSHISRYVEPLLALNVE